MKVSKVSQPIVFKKLQYTERLKTIITDENTPSKVLKDMSNVKDIIIITNSHKKKYVDVILDCNDYGEFSVAIASKKQGTPYHPDSTYYFRDKKKDKVDFAKWVNAWNYDFSPKGLEKLKMLKKLALEAVIKHQNAKEKIDYLVY